MMSAAIWLLAACQSGVDEPEVSAGMITFATEEASRSNTATNSSITDLPICVYGDMFRRDDSAETTLHSTFDATELRYDTSNGQWTYDRPQYWFPGYQYSFVAFCPANTSNLSSINYQNSQLQFTYNYPVSDYRKADDLLVTAHRRNYIEGTDGTVIFQFSHILSNISIQVEYVDPTGEALPLVINSITLRRIPVKADYSIVPATLSPNGWMTSDFNHLPGTVDGWTLTDRGDLTIQFPDKGSDARTIPSDDSYHSLFSADKPLLLLPNPEEATAMTISYTTFENNLIKSKTDELTIPISWLPGAKYNLSLRISNRTTIFGVTVTDWKEGTTTDTTVPRK